MPAAAKLDGKFGDEYIRNFNETLVGDQFAKIDVFLSNEELIYKLVDLALVRRESLPEALDALVSLFNIHLELQGEFWEVYMRATESIVANFRIDESENDEVLYKKLALINTCLQRDETNEYVKQVLKGASLAGAPERLLAQQIQKLLSRNGSVITREIIAGLLRLYLRAAVDVLQEQKPVVEALLLYLFRKYSDQLEFKYVVKVARKGIHAPVYNPLSNKGIENCSALPFMTAPRAVIIYDQLDKELFSLGVHVYLRIFENVTTPELRDENLWKSGQFVLFVTSFLKSDDIGLKAPALRFFTYPYFTSPNNTLPRQSLRLIIPALVQTFNYYNLPCSFDPFEILTGLINIYNETEPLNNPITDFLYRTDLVNGIVYMLSKCLSLDQQNQSSITVLAKFIRLCACLTSFDEKCRTLLLEDKNILLHAERGLESHLILLRAFVSYKGDLNEPLSESDLPPLHDSELTLSWLLLLKSFSRSITALRTSLKRDKLAELLLDIVRVVYDLIKHVDFKGLSLIRAEVGIMGAALGILSNFVVEFSNLQSYIITNGIIDAIGDVLSEPLFNNKIPWTPDAREALLEDVPSSEIKTNALWVLRHLMYNSQDKDKLELLGKIPLSVILHFVNDSNWLVQEQCFQLLRNLTCNSKKIVNLLLGSFDDSAPSTSCLEASPSNIRSTYLFDFLVHKARMLDYRDVHQRKTLEGVLYIVVNISAINENKRQLIIEQDDLLHIVQEILSKEPESEDGDATFADLQIACLWIVTNLIWNSTFSAYSQRSPIDYGSTRHNAGALTVEGAPAGEQPDKADYQTGDDIADDDASDDADKNEIVTNQSVGDGGDADEFVRPYRMAPSPKVKNAGLERCLKLVNLGIYDLLKFKSFDKNLTVREKARTVVLHMDQLREGM
ncbi:LAMI_0B04698g1_1 [Lachancea mirantina]|uniref:LAMI_0B04698g1_1 n=1 Tax=Lachancea mirantina TaxID=1230905 RepID=A0A1G4IVV5_9SACH|nr:LAMI_0B04698g1_1 [Lachancea mirantina]